MTPIAQLFFVLCETSFSQEHLKCKQRCLRPVTHYVFFLNVFSGFHVFTFFTVLTLVGNILPCLKFFFAAKVSNEK